ncbi:hypothetical protein ES965_14520 [Bacillus subtilis]|uniref:HNH endonuclease n=1 Tax=Bacillus subtilis TaxID=1423 RepID=UPI00100A0C1F|nr:HNH endonuclease [Bacillus subtilis]QAV85222.1 hypothetical protein ES965_14520 [Bacillus subtilis]WJD91336.1 HNH endonuclease [Bacillus spizizenii]
MTNEHQRLVSVESQSEYNITSGKSETRIFVKMYVDAVKKGLIADIGAERWQTLCVLSSFMNANGECYPTQDQIAGALNLSRESANRRIKALCDYRWQGRPLVVKQPITIRYKQKTNKYSLRANQLISPPNKREDSKLLIFKEISEEEKIRNRNIAGYTTFIKQVKKRDKYVCVKCGCPDNLHVHHIESYTNNPEGRTDIDNGATFCEKCHRRYHAIFGKDNANKWDFEKFMKGV